MRRRAALCLLLLAPTSALAASDWSIKIDHSGSTNASPASSSTITIGGAAVPAIYFTNDTSVYGYRADTGAALGSYSTGEVIENFPSAVPLRDGNSYVFVTSQNGFLYKLNATDLTLSASVNVRRTTADSCTTKDSLVATPTVQLEAYSNADFAYKGLKDVVYVITKHGCGDDSLNQVIAYDAATLTKLWAFNDGGERTMDYGAQGCAIDYDRNALYCGTDLKPGRSQPTLWAISTGSTGHTAGSQLWALNIGAVQTRPQLGKNQLLYVADTNGVLHAFDPATGTQVWSVNVSASVTSITQNVWAEFRAPYDHLIFVTDTTGALHVVADAYDAASKTGSGALVWNKTFTGAKAMSIAAFAPTPGKVYIGLNDGTMHQLALATKKDEATITIGAPANADAGSTVGDIILDATFLITPGATDINKIITIADGSGSATNPAVIKRFSIPIVGTTASDLIGCDPSTNDPNDPDAPNSVCKTDYNSPPDCAIGNATNDCCGVGRCIPDPNDTTGKKGFCGTVARTKGPGLNGNTNQCNDGKSTCTTNKVCRFGGCVGTWNLNSDCAKTPAQACALDPQQGCGPGKSCYCPSGSGTACKAWACLSTGDGGTRLTYTYSPTNGCSTAGCPDGGTCNTSTGECSLPWSPCGSQRQSCDDQAPPGVITHGGNRTCTNGVCGRQTKYCDAPSDEVLAKSKDSSGYEASLDASGLAFGRQYNADKATTCTAYLSAYGKKSPNVIREVTPAGAVIAHPVKDSALTSPYFMHGVTVVHQNESTQADHAIVTFPTTPADAVPYLGWADTTNGASTVGRIGDPGPTTLTCKTAPCPFTVKEFNYFPTAPTSNGVSLLLGGKPAAGLVFAGNYKVQGDVYQLSGATGSLVASSIWTNTGDAKGAAEWSSAVAAGPDSSLLTKSSELLRVAHGSRIDFVGYVLKSKVWGARYVLDLASPQTHFAVKGPPPRGGVGPFWAAAGMRYITAVTSLAADWLNQTDDTYAEVREERPSGAKCGGTITYVVQIRGDDYSVRPLADYKDLDCQVQPGLYTVLGLPIAYVPPPLGTVAANGEGRLTTDTISLLHRLIPNNPASSSWGTPAKITSYLLPP